MTPGNRRRTLILSIGNTKPTGSTATMTTTNHPTLNYTTHCTLLGITHTLALTDGVDLTSDVLIGGYTRIGTVTLLPEANTYSAISALGVDFGTFDQPNDAMVAVANFYRECIELDDADKVANTGLYVGDSWYAEYECWKNYGVVPRPTPSYRPLFGAVA